VGEPLRPEKLRGEAAAGREHERSQTEARAGDEAATIDIQDHDGCSNPVCVQKLPLIPTFHIEP
jgi:hypothetical protein